MQEIKIFVVFLSVGGISAVIYQMALDRYKYLIPLMASWMAIVASALFIQNVWAAFLVVLLIKLVVVKNDVEKSIVFFLSLLPVFPASYQFPFVKPGFLYFVDLSMPMVLAIVFLLPLIPALLRNDEDRIYRSDILFVLLMGLFVFGAFRERYEFQITLFAGIRDVFVTLFSVFIPYYVISRGLRGTDSINNAVKGIVLTGIFIAVFAYVEAILKWKVYTELGGYLGAFGAASIHNLYEVRYGLLRVAVSLTHPITLGFYISFVFGLAVYLLRIRNASRPAYLMLYVLFIGAMYLTVSRGAWIGFALLLFVLMAYQVNPRLRRLLLVISVLAIPLAFMTGAGNGSEDGGKSGEVDQFGTFEYRYNLALASFEVIPRQFFFGSRTYKAYPEMQELEQGQKIIDIVNGYIHIALEFGMIALAIFMILIMRSVLEGVRSRQFGSDYEDDSYKYLGISLIAIMYSLALQFAFTSFGGQVESYLFVAMALARSVKFSREEIMERTIIEPVDSANKPGEPQYLHS